MESYKLRKLRKDKDSEDYDAASIAVPMEIARVLPDIRFRPTLTDEGLLYKPVAGTETTLGGDLPAWLKPAKPAPAKAK